MEKLPCSHIEKGVFLVSTPEIETGLFFRSVVLVCEHTPQGSFGLVINKKLEIELPEEILDIKESKNPNIGIRAAGPVQTNQMMLLHTLEKSEIQTLPICPGVFLGGDLNFLQELAENSQNPFCYLCFGYAGWGAGQLEREFLEGSWLLAHSTKELIFDVPPEKLWQTLLRQMGGKWSTLSMIPDDLTLN